MPQSVLSPAENTRRVVPSILEQEAVDDYSKVG